MFRGDRKRALVYGSGNFYKSHKEDAYKEFEIAAFLDTYREGIQDNIPVCRPGRGIMQQYGCDTILIMVENMHAFFEIVSLLRSVLEEEELDKIVWGITKYGEQKDSFNALLVLPDGKMQITVNGISLCVSTEDQMNNVLDTLLNQCYCYCINNEKKDIVIDVGMNIADSTLYFLNNERVEKVYGYEPFPKTFLNAKENLKGYLADSRLEIYQYGLSVKNERRILQFQCQMSCGQSTDQDANEKAKKNYENWGLLESGMVKESVEVKSAAEEIDRIVRRHPDNNIVLKMDCEGEEYGIIQVLAEYGVLHSIGFIMLEWHYKGNKPIIDVLHRAGFSYFCHDKNPHTGLVYAWKN